jgi:hypothetical protein
MAEVMDNPQGGNEQQGYLLDMLFPGFRPIEGMNNMMGGIGDWMTRPPNIDISRFAQDPGSMPAVGGTITGLQIPQGMMPQNQPGPSFEDQYNQLSPGDQAAVDYTNSYGGPGGSLGGPGLQGPTLNMPNIPMEGVDTPYIQPGGIQTDPKASEPLSPVSPGGLGEGTGAQPSAPKQEQNVPISQIVQDSKFNPADLSMFKLDDTTVPPEYDSIQKSNDIDYRQEVERINKIMPDRLEDIQKRPAGITEGKGLGRLMLEGIVIRMAGYSPLEVWNSYDNKRQEQWKQDVDYALKKMDVRREAEWKILNYKIAQQDKARDGTLKRSEMLLNANPRLAENPKLWEDVGYGLGMSPTDAKQWALDNRDPGTGRFKLAITPEQRFLNQKLSEMKVLQMVYPEASSKDLAAAAFFQDSKGILADARTKTINKIQQLVMDGAPEEVIQKEREKLLSLENATKQSGIEDFLDTVKVLNRIPGLKEMMGEDEFNRLIAIAAAQSAGVKGYTPQVETAADKATREYIKAQAKAPTFQHKVITTMNARAGESKELYDEEVRNLDTMVKEEAKVGANKLDKKYADQKKAYMAATTTTMQSDGTIRGQALANVINTARSQLLAKGIDFSLADMDQMVTWYESGVDLETVFKLVTNKILPKYGYKPSGTETPTVPPKQTGQQPTPTPQGTGTSKGYSSFEPLIKSVAIENKVDPALLAAMVEVESKFNPTAVSKTGAMGLMQLMPPTARELGVKNPFSPEESLKGGARYIKQLLDDYNGDVNKALAAYNYGPGNLKRSNILPLETRAYVNNVLKARTKYLAQASTTPGMV